MEQIVDACSVILLAKATVLEELTKWKTIFITKGVYNEVIEGKEKKLMEALLLDRLVDEKKIKVKNNINKKITQKLMIDFGLGIGESESIALALEKNIKEVMIISDNRQGRKAAKVYGMNLIGSIGIVLFLFKTEKINREKAIIALKVLKKFGWFHDYLIEEALDEVKNG